MDESATTISPSNFARLNIGRYIRWAESPSISFGRKIPLEIEDECRSLEKLVIPSNLLVKLEEVVEHPLNKHQKLFADKLLQDLQKANTEQTDDTDRNGIMEYWPFIAKAHEKILECNTDSSKALSESILGCSRS